VPASGSQRRSWGWHRLTDEWARRLVADAAIRCGDTVVDAGAGDGALTGPLLATGARVIAVELHPRRAERLRRTFAGTGLRVVEVDLREFRWPGHPFRVVANPPFAATSTLLAGLLARGSALVAADLVLQRAVARDLAEGSRGARHVRRTFRIEQGRSLPRRAFDPPPRVDTSVLVVRRCARVSR
jgi:23S rRNA (adenine-N6)-dimethyltransferase